MSITSKLRWSCINEIFSRFSFRRLFKQNNFEKKTSPIFNSAFVNSTPRVRNMKWASSRTRSGPISVRTKGNAETINSPSRVLSYLRRSVLHTACEVRVVAGCSNFCERDIAQTGGQRNFIARLSSVAFLWWLFSFSSVALFRTGQESGSCFSTFDELFLL